jgi:hypothetical protein
LEAPPLQPTGVSFHADFTVYQESAKNPHSCLPFPITLSFTIALAIAEVEMLDKPCQPTFEEVYPRYEFAPLVTAALYAAEWINRRFALKRGSLEVAPQGSTPATKT